MVYDPGITPRRTKLQSKSLWSLRNISRCDSGSFATRPTITPASGVSPRFANPSTVTTPPTKNTAMLKDAPGVTLTSCPEISTPSDEERTTEYGLAGEKTRIAYLPARRTSEIVSPRPSTRLHATLCHRES